MRVCMKPLSGKFQLRAQQPARIIRRVKNDGRPGMLQSSRGIIVVIVLAASGLVNAATYTLPANIGTGPFSSCSFSSGTTYNCTADIILADNVTIVLTSSIILNIPGRKFEAGDNVTINSPNSGFTISIIAGDDIQLGDNFVGFISLQATNGSRIETGSSTTITGNLTASELRLDNGTTVFGTCTPSNSRCFAASSGPDHYELTVPASNISCLASTITVVACANTSNPCTNKSTTLNGKAATLATNAGALAATSITFNASGDAATTLSYAAATNGAAATVTLSGEQTAATNARKCCIGGSCSTANSCALTFNTAGFIFAATSSGAVTTMPTQVAGTSSSTFYLRAVQTGTASTGGCVSALAGSQSVNLAYQCNNPITCSTSNLLTVNAGANTAIQRNNNNSVAIGSIAYLPVNMTFDGNGSAPFTFSFGDAGQATLLASKSASGSLLTTLTGSSNAFVTKPGGFVLSNILQTAAPNLANPAATLASSSKFVKAGEAFSVTVTATTSGGTATPNYGKEVSPETVKLTAALVGGLGLTNNPGLTNPTAFGAFTNGVATGSTFGWGEVGIITLAPSVGDADYLGTGDVAGTISGNVGRFFPDHFALTSGTTTPGCSGLFTYFGQDGFITPFTLVAQNLANSTTQNYAGAFVKLGLTTWSNFGFTVSGLPAGSTLTSGTTTPTGIWTLGSAAVSATQQISRPTALTGQTSVIVNAAPIDSDLVTMTSAAVASSTPLRFGRLRIANGAGSQNRNLKIAVATQYWNGTNFITNMDDSCTQLSSTAFSFGNLRKTLTSADAVIVGSPLIFAAGLATLTLQKPVAGHTGTYDLAILLGGSDTSCLQSWAPGIAASASANRAFLQGGWCTSGLGGIYGKDPSARISFGLYRGADSLIYLRENY